MEHVKSINLVLEPYENVELSAEEIGAFGCDNITTRIARVARNSIARQLVCERMYLELRSDVNTMFDEERKLSVFDRLGIPDITAVVVTYEDDSTEYIFVPLCQDEQRSQYECWNQYQTSYVTSRGDFRLLIDTEQEVREFFGDVPSDQ